MNDAGEQRWPPLYGPLALITGLVVGLFGGVIVELIAHAGGASLNHVSPGLTDLETVIQDLGFIVAAVYLAARVGAVNPRQFGLSVPAAPWRAAGLVVAALISFYVVSDAWLALLHHSGSEKSLVKDIGGDSGTLGILAACAVTCVVAPICEEFLFRGFIFTAIRNWRGIWPAALITGVLFGGVHGLSAPAVDLLPLGFLGVLLCLVYAWTGSLYSCIALHVLNNSIALGADEHWGLRIVELALASLAIVALSALLVRRVVPQEGWAPAQRP